MCGGGDVLGDEVNEVPIQVPDSKLKIMPMGWVDRYMNIWASLISS